MSCLFMLIDLTICVAILLLLCIILDFETRKWVRVNMLCIIIRTMEVIISKRIHGLLFIGTKL